MFYMNVFLVALLRSGAAFVLSAALFGAHAQSPADNAPRWQRVELNATGAANARYPFAIYSNRLWTGDMRGVTSAVLIFHGLGRNGVGYFAAAAKLLAESGLNAGANGDEVLLIAPNFFIPADAKNHVLDGMPLWSSGGASAWMRGGDAVNWPRPLSAFEVIDDLLTVLSDPARFPRLERIVVAGHSAGGQIVQRYAALNAIDETVRASGKRPSYIVANPSSYLYFTPERVSASNAAGIAPFDAAACPDFNHYRYGLENLPRYARDARDASPVDSAALFKRYAVRDVTYLLGTADNDPEHRDLDKQCGGRAQGAHRLERGRNYIRYERHLAGSATSLNRRAYEVIDVAHSQARMFGSRCGAMLLFGAGAQHNASGAMCRELQF